MAQILYGTISGAWLMQTIQLNIPVPSKIEYTVRHRGDGNNKLRVRFGNFLHLVWGQVHDFEIEPGKSKSRDVSISKDTTGSNDDRQDVRWRLSRGALTKAIDWELTLTVTRLQDETDITTECEHTITNEK